jgi:hypothetical protein
MSARRYKVEGVFQITGRGAVVAIGEKTDLPVGKALHATVFLPDGTQLSSQAFKEWVLRRDPNPFEKEAYLLHGVEKSQVPEGSSIELEAI